MMLFQQGVNDNIYYQAIYLDVRQRTAHKKGAQIQNGLCYKKSQPNEAHVNTGVSAKSDRWAMFDVSNIAS